MPSVNAFDTLQRSSAYSSLNEQPLWAYAVPSASDPNIYIVSAVIVIDWNTIANRGQFWANVLAPGTSGIWIETSYSGAYRGYYAGIGYSYSPNSDLFYPVGAAVPTSPSNLATASSILPICFARGTRISGQEGLVLIESLKPHATVIDHDNKRISVKWIGYQRRTPEFAQFDDYLPVKICAGALAENIPVRDLYLSPDHAILVDGHLIHAKALVNGKSIVQMTEWEGDIEYYHIETENHEIIFAEGVPCETFIDNVSRQQFDNYAEYQALYPFSTVMKELPLPRVRHRRQLPSAIAARIDQRAQVLARQASS
jgi:hypothetical protein